MPIFFNTTEVRWFLPGEIPHEVQGWFDNLEAVQHQPSRVDLYLPGSGPGMGIKLREGRLELKIRKKKFGSISLSEQITGSVESWVKWGVSMPFSNPAWIPVDKERQILFYQVAENGKVEKSTPGVIPSQGGGVELTRVLLGGELPWWTIGIEVFAPDSGGFGVLEMIARLAFNRFPVSLQVGQSFGYPVLVSKY